MSRTRTFLVAALAATALVGAGAAFGASATMASSSSPTGALDALAFETVLGADDPGEQSDRRDHGQRLRHRGGERLLHAEVVVKGKDGAPVTVALQRGTVSAVDDNSVTVKSEDGYERTWTLTDDTRYRSGREESAKDAVTVGANVGLVGPVSGDATTARVVGIPPAEDKTTS